MVALLFTNLYYNELVTSYSSLGEINVSTFNSPAPLFFKIYTDHLKSNLGLAQRRRV